MKDKIKVLVVDDAVVVRILVGNAVSQDPDLELVGKAQNGKVALEQIIEHQPDLVVLDLEMPEMDGLELLKALQEQRLSTKVLMFSTYTTVGAQQTFEALELGAIDFVPKPSNTGFSKGFEQVHEELLSKIKFIGSARSPQAISSLRRSPRLTSPPVAAASDYEVIVFEGGMGAPKTFMNIIPELPADQTPGVVLFQAMFSGFAEQFVRRLDRNAQISVKAAENNDPVQSGKGLVLFGDYYASVKRSAGKTLQLAFREKDDTEKYGTVPRLLFESVARTCGSKAIGVILAGAGEANLDGIQAMKDHGALIITEETTSIMGRRILDQLIERQIVDTSVPAQEIPTTLKKTLGIPA